MSSDADGMAAISTRVAPARLDGPENHQRTGCPLLTDVATTHTEAANLANTRQASGGGGDC